MGEVSGFRLLELDKKLIKTDQLRILGTNLVSRGAEKEA
jgi:hypothetical protein